jgi:hypothetical protein
MRRPHVGLMPGLSGESAVNGRLIDLGCDKLLRNLGYFGITDVKFSPL